MILYSRPEYAEGPSSDSDSEDELRANIIKKSAGDKEILPSVISTAGTSSEQQDDNDEDVQPIPEEAIKSDRRLQRLMNRVKVDEEDNRGSGRRIREPEILEVKRRPIREDAASDSESGDDEEVERRHALLRRLKQKEEEEEQLRKEEEGDRDDDDDDEEDEESEEYTSSSEESEEDALPRLKPVFVKKSDRITVKERELEEKKEKEREERAVREAEERRAESLRIIEQEVKREEKEKEQQAEDEAMRAAIDAVDTDDEADAETEYELWKVRELKRIRREKEEREEQDREEAEKERLRNMTEEERQAELEKNPRLVTNKQEKGKYKFMQKYFHRGAFYLDQEDEVFKRDFAQPTLEDHFDKSVLPSVMQVKNFGRSGRTKYTHLVDQDTTAHDSPWTETTPQTTKLLQTGGGFKPIFERPSKKRKV